VGGKYSFFSSVTEEGANRNWEQPQSCFTQGKLKPFSTHPVRGEGGKRGFEVTLQEYIARRFSNAKPTRVLGVHAYISSRTRGYTIHNTPPLAEVRGQLPSYFEGI